MNVLVIGSSLFDVIIPFENNSHVTVENNKATFSLGDKVPIDIKAFTIGGNAPNVASALRKLEIPSVFYTYLGEDALSHFIRDTLQEEGIKLHYENTSAKTGPLSLIFNFPTDRTIFSHHPNYEHTFDAEDIEQPTHIFLTSIGSPWEKAYEQILSYANEKHIPIAFSPGSSQMKNMNETFVKTIHQSKMLFCNMEEARSINEHLSGSAIIDPKELLLNLKNSGFELLSVTDAANGAYAIDKDSNVYKIPTMKPEGHEKTGAGDAYAGAFLAAYIEGKDIPTCMERGVLNSLGVMSHVGAHTGQLTKDEMQKKSEEIELIATII